MQDRKNPVDALSAHERLRSSLRPLLTDTLTPRALEQAGVLVPKAIRGHDLRSPGVAC